MVDSDTDFISVNPVSKTRSIGQPGNCHNRLGKNQYKGRPLPDDPQVAAALRSYHRKGINDSEEISRLLLEEHEIILCASSVKRRRQKLGLLASRATTLQMGEVEKRRLVVEAMAQDPKGKCGAKIIKQRIFQESGIHLSRDYIREEMRKLDPESYAKRGPRHMKVKRLERLARDAQTLPSATSDRPVSNTRTQQPLATRFIVHVSGSGRPTRESRENDLASQSENDFLESETLDGPPSALLRVGTITFCDQQTPSAAGSPATANATALLESAIPAMTTLTRFLNDLGTSNFEFDLRTHELFIRGIESAALLERQLSRIVSSGRIVGRHAES